MSAEFSLNPEMPLITAIGVGTTAVVRNASPQYWANTGKRRGRAGLTSSSIILATTLKDASVRGRIPARPRDGAYGRQSG